MNLATLGFVFFVPCFHEIMAFHREKKIALIRDLAAKFFGERSNRSSLITVTSVDLAIDSSTVDLGISVLPDSHEAAALDFARRQAGELRQYIGAHAKLGAVPFINVVIDQGEKNRQRVDTLLAEGVANKE